MTIEQRKLPPIEDTFGMGAVPVADALRQREAQLRTALSSLEEAQVTIAELRAELSRYKEEPCPKNLDGHSFDSHGICFHCGKYDKENDLLKDRLRASGDGGWISVETEMPPSNEDVLVRWGVPEQSTDVAMYLLGDDEWWCNARGAYLHRITHWQPIQPPLIEAQTPEMEAK